MTSISFCGYGLILYYAFNLDKDLNGEINGVFLCLPFLFGISFFNILKYTIRMLGMGAYIGNIEKSINTIVKKNIYMWHSKLVYVNGYNFVGVASFPCNMALFVIALFKFKQNMHILLAENKIILLYALLLLSIVAVIIVSISLIVCANQYHAVKYWSDEIYNSNIDIKTPHLIKRPPKKAHK